MQLVTLNSFSWPIFPALLSETWVWVISTAYLTSISVVLWHHDSVSFSFAQDFHIVTHPIWWLFSTTTNIRDVIKLSLISTKFFDSTSFPVKIGSVCFLLVEQVKNSWLPLLLQFERAVRRSTLVPSLRSHTVALVRTQLDHDGLLSLTFLSSDIPSRFVKLCTLVCRPLN